MKRSAMIWGLVPALLWAALWLWITCIMLIKHDPNGLWLLAIYTVPSSTIVFFLSSGIPDSGTKDIVYLGGFLIFGMLQYGLLGYLFGVVFRGLVKLWRT